MNLTDAGGADQDFGVLRVVVGPHAPVHVAPAEDSGDVLGAARRYRSSIELAVDDVALAEGRADVC